MAGRVNLPGWLWIVLLAGGPMLAAWLEQYFGGTGWAAPVSGLIVGVVAVLKLVQEYQREPDAKPLPVMELAPSSDSAVAPTVTAVHEAAPQRSIVDRVLFG